MNMGAHSSSEANELEKNLRAVQERLEEYIKRNSPFCQSPPISTAATKEVLFTHAMQNAIHGFEVEVRTVLQGATSKEDFYNSVIKLVEQYKFRMPDDEETRISVTHSTERLRQGIIAALHSRAVENLNLADLL